ncbi:MAG: hypothetical protein WB565_13255 [Acidimicrobiales bacterium]
MAQTSAGLTNGGVTTHYAFTYDDSLGGAGGVEPARTNAVIASCEADYAVLSGWFGGNIDVTGMTVQVTTQSGGAGWGGSATASTVTLKAQGFAYSNNPAFLRYLLIAEVSEIFMMAQNIGWFQNGNEGSKGEGLSRFLSGQFLVQNGFLGLGIDTDFSVADLWLNSSRQDFVNNDPDDNGYDATNGCTTLFIYYLFHQLGFTIDEIVAAGSSTLSGVYQNLTGDASDPFPLFSLLLGAAFPSTTASAVPGPNFDDPWPIGILSFVVDKSTFGHDEVADALSGAAGAGSGSFLSFWLMLLGFSQRTVGGATPVLSGPAAGLAGITYSPDPMGIGYELPNNTLAPQLIRFPFDVNFTQAGLANFPATGAGPTDVVLDGSITILGSSFDAATELELVAGADPYFMNIDPSQNNVSWLSNDLRVFSASQSLDSVPVPGGPTFQADTYAAAYQYVQDLLSWLNANYSDPTGTDPFNPTSNILPEQSGSLSGDSSVTPTVESGGTGHAVYNFAIARVRLRGAVASSAQDVRVFFRLWGTQTADTDFEPSTYPSNDDAAGYPDWPLAATDSHTIPFFATSNAPDFADPNNPEYGANGVNDQTITVASGDSQWSYFGCFLNVYDPANMVNGQQIQAVLSGTHHCLVAQIAYDDAPIVNANGITESPGNCDKLAQRNLQVTSSDNPGDARTHLVPQTVDLRPSAPLTLGSDPLLQIPDELMIDWGRTPRGSVASLFWPQVDATAVVALAKQSGHPGVLLASDANTIECQVEGGVTYVPIPPGGAGRFASLLSVQLPLTVMVGQQFDIVVRRIATRRVSTRLAVNAFAPRRANPVARAAVARQPTSQANWRYVTGAFQIRIPVTTTREMLPEEESTLKMLRSRLNQLASSNRWYPVLQRLIEQLSERVDGLRNGKEEFGPPPDGWADSSPSLVGTKRHRGRVTCVNFDCFGAFQGFELADCGWAQSFHSHEVGIGEIVVRACTNHWLLHVETDGEEPERITRVSLLS